ncbi:hypothetical protein L7F22_054579 [Adiantum nelumboides]|nr:hypothetical protein [Adiantum nelumboides]
MDFKKAFDTVPRANLWNRLESLGVPAHLRKAIAQIYYEVRFMSTMGVKQGCPLSPILFGLCIDQLEEIVQKYVGEEEDRLTIGALTVLILMYADDVVLLANSVKTLQKLMNVLQEFCNVSGLAVNVAKTKAMVIKTHKNRDQPIITYNGQEIEIVDNFKYLGIDIPSNHAWWQCAQRRLDAGKAKYYQFENMCKQSTVQRWELRAMIFDTCGAQTMLYGVKVWGGSISASTWNDMEKI